MFIHGGYNTRALGTLLKRKKHLDEFYRVPKLPTFDRALPHPIVCALPNEQYEEVVKRFSGGAGVNWYQFCHPTVTNAKFGVMVVGNRLFALYYAWAWLILVHHTLAL